MVKKWINKKKKNRCLKKSPQQCFNRSVLLNLHYFMLIFFSMTIFVILTGQYRGIIRKIVMNFQNLTKSPNVKLNKLKILKGRKLLYISIRSLETLIDQLLQFWRDFCHTFFFLNFKIFFYWALVVIINQTGKGSYFFA